MNLRGTISEYERKMVDKHNTPKKDVFAAKQQANKIEREMTNHQRALTMMDPGHTKVNKLVVYGCQ